MWRQKNETDEDLKREREVSALIEEHCNCQVIKLSEQLYGLDWAIFRNGKIVAFAEFKKRGKRYPTLILSFAKWLKGVALSDASAVPFLLIVEWEDGVYLMKRMPGDSYQGYSIELSGSSRAQNGDLEPCIHIPVELFQHFLTFS